VDNGFGAVLKSRPARDNSHWFLHAVCVQWATLGIGALSTVNLSKIITYERSISIMALLSGWAVGLAALT